MKRYEELDLLPLPEGWSWERGEQDGDPAAFQDKDGERIATVHETYAGFGYTNRLTVSVKKRAFFKGVPLEVFVAVDAALREQYDGKPGHPP